MAQAAQHGVSLQVGDGVATLALGGGLRRNAIRLSTWLALPDLIGEAEQDPATGVLVLRGEGGVFGAGNDISELAALRGNPAAALAYGLAMAKAMEAVETASKPVLAAIEGECYGASVALALASDIRLAAADATFAITPAKLGAVYLASDLHRLIAAVGPSRAKQLIYTSQTIGAMRAKEIGLVDDVVAQASFDAELAILAKTVLRGSPFTLRCSKAELLTGSAPATETPESLSVFVEATQGADFSEGVDAFLAKRPPQFR